ncbi:MAG: hypothetical protein ACRC3Y_10405 [Romboutsia sp.]|uniref:hypothetical protein n=1 Tax=Romboutsia sp. TaxID=1965302 RepID=UPI003F30AFD3
MKSDDCNRRKLLFKEFIHDWDELNIAFKSLIIIGIALFVVVMLFAFFSDGGKGIKNSLEVVFRSTLASVFGFLLSSNIKSNSKKKNTEIQKIKLELKKIQSELDDLNQDNETQNSFCDLEDNYLYKDINLVQIIIALSICILCICILGFLLITNNLENVPAISQIRDLMCSSIGFLIGESGKR